MKSLFIVMAGIFATSVHASYRADELANWFTIGKTQGVNQNGKGCVVTLVRPTPSSIYYLNVADYGQVGGTNFNGNANPNKLEYIKETATSLEVVARTIPSNNNLTVVKQTLNVTKMPKGTKVSVESRNLTTSETRQNICTIN